jgi:predicted glycosyltransferase
MHTVWIDLDNAPHVPFFAPLIDELEKRGYETLVTVRDYGYTCALADQHGIPYTRIGRHAGKNLLLKVGGTLSRVGGLIRWARGRQIDAAISHGSRSLVIACAFLRIPSVTMYDYEFVSTSILNKLSSRVLLPDILPDSLTNKIGLQNDRVAKYPGLKEEVYLGDFKPDRSILADLDVSEEDIVVVVRPPATAAHYHNPLSERIVQTLLDRISASEKVVGVVTPRTAQQAESISKNLKNPGNFRVLTKPVNGLNLIAHSDLVVGGGGTMNREAALLGVPVYSVFTGKIGTIDRALAERGKLVLVRTLEDVDRVVFAKRDRVDYASQMEERKTRSAELAGFICDEVQKVIR